MNVAEIADRAVRVHGAVQDPWELAAVLAVLAASPPELIVEIGCWSGGSLHAWRQTGAEVIGVTLPEHANILRDHGAAVILADSRQCRGQLDSVLAGRVPGFVFIDGGHDHLTCLSDWELARQVAPGAVIGFHDIACPDWPDPGRVWADVSRGYPSVAIIRPDAKMGTGLVFT